MSDDLPRPTPPPEANADLTTLRGYGYSDAQIASMSPGHLAREVAAIKAEDARRVQEAADAGYVPTPQEPAPAVPQPEIGTLAPKKRYWPSVALSCAVVVGFFVVPSRGWLELKVA